MTTPTTTSAQVRAQALRRIVQLCAAAAALLLIAVAGWLFSRLSAASTSPVAALQGLALDAVAAGRGEAAALKDLQAHVQQLKRLAADSSGEAWSSDPRLPKITSSAEGILRARAQLSDAGGAVHEVRKLVPGLLKNLVDITTGMSGTALESMQRPLERFEVRAQRLQIELPALVAGAPNASRIAQRLADSADYMGQVVNGLAGSDPNLSMPRPVGPDGQRLLEEMKQSYSALNADVQRVVAAAPALAAAAIDVNTLGDNSRALAAVAAKQASAASAPWWPLLPALLALLPLYLIFRAVGELRRESEQQVMAVVSQRKDTDRNQEAILRLLDELSSLADGDLTVQATVTEDITGAIADSINYAVEALRGLVATINGSAIQLDGATRQTQALSQQLAKASNAQSKQIGSASETVVEMASFTAEVSGNAERAADVARHSVDVAHKGGDAVRRTIDGMNAIRETIQDTSKRIKRLGESSQEIGNIVELINDIAEQTNILALNASIQASMAGEAGRGFAVVADEVQRLAERAANATKQIEVLVRTIQTDTNEAVVSMERSTTDVVGGALLAENAGAALEEIEQVSNQIASLVQNISGSSRQQSAAAQNIARNMQVLKEISTQTADSTSATSLAIAKLAELSAGLRTSVSGFRLPALSGSASSATRDRAASADSAARSAARS